MTAREVLILVNRYLEELRREYDTSQLIFYHGQASGAYTNHSPSGQPDDSQCHLPELLRALTQKESDWMQVATYEPGILGQSTNWTKIPNSNSVIASFYRHYTGER